MTHRRIYVTGLIFLAAILFNLSGFGAKPVYATYRDLVITKKDSTNDAVLSGWTFKVEKWNGSSWVLEPGTTSYPNPGITNASGQVRFRNLHWNVNYRVCETIKSGWTPVSPTDSNGCRTINLQDYEGTEYVTYTNTPASAKLGDKVWKDLDKDGVQDGGEPGVSGVTVTLYGANCTGTALGTDTTDGSGLYLFEGLAAGTYSVKFSLPTGYIFTHLDQGGNDTTDSDANTSTGCTVNTTLTAGEDDRTWDAGLKTATLGDKVWNDLDRDGVQDGGESGVSGVTVTLYGANCTGTVLGTDTTDGSGLYLFEGLVAGTYSVKFTLPSGYVISPIDQGGNDTTDSDANTSTGCTINTTLSAAEDDRTWDMGIYQQPAKLGDKVWKDLDKDGVQDGGEPGVSGVTVTLYGANCTGTVLGTDTTDGDGLYLFENLTPGTYSVKFTLPTGYIFTHLDQGGNDSTDSDANTSTGCTVNTTLTANEDDRTWDAGLKTATLGDKVWLDLDRDGVQDDGESGVSGVTVTLYGANCTGTVLGTDTTDGSGLYLFEGLVAGTYSVKFTLPSGYVISPIDQGGNDATDSDANTSTGCTINTTLSAAEDDRTWDMGIYQQPAKLGDKVWLDLDKDGVQDGGSEVGVQNVTVTLYGPNCTGSALGTDTTDSNGLYLFENLTPGTYSVKFTLPAGYYFSAIDQGGNDGTDSDANTTTGCSVNTVLTANEDDRTWDAGIYNLAKLGDKVWLDSDKDGVQDGGSEVGVQNVTVTLYGPNCTGTALGTDTTDGSGLYLFENLQPGTYSVKFTLPTGYFFSPIDQGGNDGTDSDANTTTGCSINTTLTAGEDDRTWDAGIYNLAKLGDKVWLDLDKDGVQDGGSEVGVQNVTVTLYGPNCTGTALGTDTTDGSGLYLFENLQPGTYSVKFTLPTNYFFSPLDQGGNDATDSDANTSTGCSINTTLVAGEDDRTWDAGIYNLAKLGDKVWEDLDKDGVQDGGEPGVSGVTVTLYGPNCTGSALGTDTTDGSGLYLFENLQPGTYSVKFTVPSNYYVSPIDQGGNDAADSDANTSTGCTVNTTLVAGEDDRTWDMGIYLKVPGIEIKKYTNGADADNANGNDVPEISPAGQVIWTYVVSNTGNVPFAKSDVVVTDNRGVTPTFDQVLSGDGDSSLEPGEIWQYKATGTALTLVTGGGDYIVEGCKTAQDIARPTYNNVGMVTVTGTQLTDTDPSHYCNPEVPGIEIKKYTNGADADNANGNDVPEISPTGLVTWTYVVSNTGNVPFTKASVVVTDNRGVTPNFDKVLAGDADETFEPGEIWQYKATGTALTLVTGGGDYIVEGCKTAQDVARPTYNNVGFVNVTGTQLTDNDPSHYCNPEVPGIEIKKYTNGADADNANGNDVPEISPAGLVTWTYVVSNTGNTPFTKASVVVTDNRGVTPIFDKVLVGDADETFEPGEIWQYKATGTALTLVTGGGDYIVEGCKTAQDIARPTYNNVGTVSITGTQLTDNDPSHYCNPEVPGIEIKKYTNGADADNANGNDVPEISPTGEVIWTYVVSNTGNVPFTKASVIVTDNRGVTPNFDKVLVGDVDETFEPGEIWQYKATGAALTLVNGGGDYIVEGCQVGQNVSRPTYNNIGTVNVTGTQLTDTDPSHYCNPVVPGITIKKYTNDEDADTPTGPVVEVGSTVTWTYFVNNTGNVPLASVVVTDNIAGVTPVYISGDVNNNQLLDLTETWLYRTTGIAIVGQYANIGYTKGTPPEGPDVDDDDPSHYFGSETPLSALGDRVWHDMDADGVQDDGEVGVANVKVNLLQGDCSTSTGKSTTTNANGIYGFSNLVAGDYCVEFDLTTLPTGFIVSPSNVGGNDAVDSDGNSSTGKTASVNLPAGTENLTIDLGIYELATLGNWVWVDADKNGAQDDGEVDVAGVKVTLYNSNNEQVGQPTTTNAQGEYLFIDLTPGTYYVIFDPTTLPANFSFTSANGGGITDDKDSDPDVTGKTQAVTLKSGDDYRDLDAGIVEIDQSILAELGDTVWYDVNNNGIQDGVGTPTGEKGVAGVVVNLFTSNGSFVATDTTDTDGKYLFTELQPGSYYVEFASVAGYSYTRYNVTGNSQDAVDSDPLVPWVDVSISNGDAEGELGEPLAYMVSYTNTDVTLAASNVVISTTIPTGTSFVAESSNPGWVCSNPAAGNVCTLTLPTLAANTSGSATFVVLLSTSEPAVPDQLDIFVDLTQGTLARTQAVPLGAGESNLTVDAGLVIIESQLTTPTPTDPTNLPGGEQPNATILMFLPAVEN